MEFFQNLYFKEKLHKTSCGSLNTS